MNDTNNDGAVPAWAADLERGLANRRAMLGDAWVDRSLGNATGFNAEFQNLITRYAWHEVWGRPGLEPKVRRIIVLAITAANARWEEYELHTRAALASTGPDRLTVDELREVLIQTAVYAGVPAANTAVAIAAKLLRELGIEPGPGDVLGAAHPGVGARGFTAGPVRLHFTVREARQATARGTVVLSHALGVDHSMWDALASTLAAQWRVVAYDHRGHGESSVPAGPYALADLADDAARVIAATGSAPVVWIGLSMGGMVGQELALRHPQRVRALVLANTAGGYPPEAQAMWQQRIDKVRAGGLAAIAETVLGRYFHAGFHATQRATVERFRRRLLATDAAGYVACCEAVRALDTLPRLRGVTLPALVIAGEHDVSTPPAMAEALAAALPNAQLTLLREASHISVIEQPLAFAQAVQNFLATL